MLAARSVSTRSQNQEGHTASVYDPGSNLPAVDGGSVKTQITSLLIKIDIFFYWRGSVVQNPLFIYYYSVHKKLCNICLCLYIS
jgi:hypothetical protein